MSFNNLTTLTAVSLTVRDVNRAQLATTITRMDAGVEPPWTVSRRVVAGCYTFGSPRVGSVEFGEDIKPPIYRVVNAADVVPHVPPSYTLDGIYFVFRLFPDSLFLVKPAKIFIKGFMGYRHHGDMRFLTACKSDYSDLKLLSNPDLFDRLGRWIKRVITNRKAGFTDHGIANYCNKLKAYAIKRSTL